MSDIEHLLSVVDAYREATGLAEATISTRFLGRGGRIGDLRGGGDIGARLMVRTIERFSRNWPGNAVWPSCVARPEPSADPAAQPGPAA